MDPTGGLFTAAALRAAQSPLHSVAEAGAQEAVAKDWQDGLNRAVQEAVDRAARVGLNRRGRVRAATRADAAYRRKHPQP